MKPPASNPCGSCPYRRDVPSGIWAKEEYLKLPDYDLETSAQPPAVFLCHQQDGRACAGWCGTHDMSNTLAVRFAALTNHMSVIDAILDYTTTTPLFASGAEACEHGMKDVLNPPPRTLREIDNLVRKKQIKRFKKERTIK